MKKEKRTSAYVTLPREAVTSDEEFTKAVFFYVNKY